MGALQLTQSAVHPKWNCHASRARKHARYLSRSCLRQWQGGILPRLPRQRMRALCIQDCYFSTLPTHEVATRKPLVSRSTDPKPYALLKIAAHIIAFPINSQDRRART